MSLYSRCNFWPRTRIFMTTFIYTLSDSTGIRYVGKADNPNQRLKGHIKEAKRDKYEKDKWVASLLKQGVRPIMEVIEEVSVENWKFAEARWIAEFKSQGCELVNETYGGEGSDGFKGKHHSEETRARIREKLKGRKASNETRKNLSIALKGKPLSEETKKKLSDKAKQRAASGANPSSSIEVRQKISEALKKYHRNKYIAH